MLEIILSGLIGGLIPVIAFYVLLKRGAFHDFIQENLGFFLQEASQNTEVQKELFTIGALLGNGIKTGVGIQKKGGKMGFEALATEIIAKFILGNQTEGSSSPSETPSSSQDRFKL